MIKQKKSAGERGGKGEKQTYPNTVMNLFANCMPNPNPNTPGAAQLLFLYNVIWTLVKGRKVSDPKVWDGAEGLEWTLPTPAPYHTFSTPPLVK